MKNKRILLILAGNMLAIFILMTELSAQDMGGFMYGKVTTVDNAYTGLIRWGKEEAFWFDYFNSSKVRGHTQEAIAEKYEDRQSTDWSNFNWDFNSIWQNAYKSSSTHQFVCQFGDIASMSDFDRSRVNIHLKNGEMLEVDGEGYNDIGTTVYVQDDELGNIAIRWEKIRHIKFMPAPNNVKSEKGVPIFGRVETFRKGTFVGFIQWDHDERLTEDKLDGDSRDGKMSIPFREIGFIEKDGNGSFVRLNSGREFYLTNSNDVNTSNRGIIVTIPGVGAIDIPWRYFKSLTLDQAPDSGPQYEDYTAPKGLSGQVITFDGKEFSGKLLYDLDEEWEVETLDAKDDQVQYTIPFRNVQAITPKNADYSMVELRNGDKLLLGGGRDVGTGNAGVLVFMRNKKDPVHIRWRDISEIIFD